VSKKEKRELHPIEVGFNEQMKEYKEFKTEQLKQYTSDGQSIDTAAFEAHFKTMFLFGKINEIEKKLEGETTDVKETGKAGKGTGSKKSSDGDDDKLQLGL